jgi:UDPglucose 6-dehydrogenase
VKVSVMGAGYVGLVTAACLAEMGNSVVCVDIDEARIDALGRGEIPIHEPGLDEIVRRNAAARRLRFTCDTEAAIRHATVIIIAVGTPAGGDGSADLRQVLDAAAEVGRHMDDFKLVVDKSTVPVGTASRVRQTIIEALSRRRSAIPFHVVSNPEFLKEGAAIDDFMHPDRVILGCDDERAELLMRSLYAPFLRNRERILVMDVASAELTKYAANAMLATRISFMNEMARLAERLGADIEQVRRGIGSDSRIGTHFLYAGLGWGGSCFPKDIRALIGMAKAVGLEMPVIEAATAVNQEQRRWPLKWISHRFGTDLTGLRIGVWGLSFKPDTDDMREAPSVDVVRALLAQGAEVMVYDPIARPDVARLWGPGARVTVCDDANQATIDASALLLLTEWREFRSPDLAALKASMREAVLIDGRNLYDPAWVKTHGFEYAGVGRAGSLRGMRSAPLATTDQAQHADWMSAAA